MPELYEFNVDRSIATGKGILVVTTQEGKATNLPPGENGQVLVADDTAPAGVRWAPVPSDSTIVFAGCAPGQPEPGQAVMIVNCTQAFRLPAGLAGSQFSCALTPTDDVQYAIRKQVAAGGGSQVGSFTFDGTGGGTTGGAGGGTTGGAGGVSVTLLTDIDFAVGDSLRIDAPFADDATMRDAAWALVGELL